MRSSSSTKNTRKTKKYEKRQRKFWNVFRQVTLANLNDNQLMWHNYYSHILYYTSLDWFGGISMSSFS